MKKFLSAFLTVTMVLGMMVMPAFADDDTITVSTVEAFNSAVSATGTAKKVVLGSDLSFGPATASDLVCTIARDCIIDLGNHTIDLTGADSKRIDVAGSNNVTFTGIKGQAKVKFDYANTAVFDVLSGSATFENIIFEKTGTANTNYMIQLQKTATKLTVKNCVAENITTSYGLITDTTCKSNFYIEDSNITATNRIFQNGTYFISGESTIGGTDVGGTVKIYTIGQNVTMTIPSEYTPESVIAKIERTSGVSYYSTLADAVAAAQDGETVTLLADADGDGICIESNTFGDNGITIDLNGYTYTVSGEAVGSANSKTNGFQLLKGNKIKIQNGKIATTDTVQNHKTNNDFIGPVSILIQNYSDLTLEGVTLDGSNLLTDGWTPYTLSNNNGNVTIKNSTITASHGFAFDVCNHSSYDGVTVTVINSNIVGNVEISRNTEDSTRAKLIIGQETYTSNGSYYSDGDDMVRITPAAERGMTVEVVKTNDKVVAGEEFTVKVVLNSEAIAHAEYTLEYDSTKFAPVSGNNAGKITFTQDSGTSAYDDGKVLAEYKFKALAQTEETTGEFKLKNATTSTFAEALEGTKVDVANITNASVTISMEAFNVNVKVDGEVVNGDSKAINYDGNTHSVSFDVTPTSYKKITTTITLDGTTVNTIKKPGTYEIAYTVESLDGYNNYRGSFTLNILPADAYFVEVNLNSGKAADYIAGKKLVLAYTDLDDVGFKYNKVDMIEVTKVIGNYQYEGTETTKKNFKHVYAYVTDAISNGTLASYKANITPFVIEEGYTIKKIDEYTFDINNSVGLDNLDPTTAMGIYGGVSVYYGNSAAQINILKADVNGDKKVDADDTTRVTLAVYGK